MAVGYRWPPQKYETKTIVAVAPASSTMYGAGDVGLHGIHNRKLDGDREPVRYILQLSQPRGVTVIDAGAPR